MSNITNRTVGQSKAEQVIKLPSRAKGAALSELTEATGWQPHSCRAFLTGLRKKGHVIERQARGDEGTAYKIIKGSPTKLEGKKSVISEWAAGVEVARASVNDTGN